MKNREFEIHIAAENFEDIGELSRNLEEIGFRDDKLLKNGVVYSGLDARFSSCPITALHVTWDSFNRDEFREKLLVVKSLLKSYSGLIGYAHAEYIEPEWDMDIEYKEFTRQIPHKLAPFRNRQTDSKKQWDIHISCNLGSLDDDLADYLHSYLNMYYIDLDKDKGIYRVFTVQGENSADSGLQLLKELQDNILLMGGMEGSIKFERACFFQKYGDCRIVPPLIGS